MRELQLRQPVHQTPATRNAFADLRARADVAYVALGERASRPMMNGSILDYQVRLNRAAAAFQKWKDTELAVIARDSSTLNTVCDQIRAERLSMVSTRQT
ncbi:hypothetical protein I6F09_25455 [Bradyrhizobium sp. IC3195]|uniref:hypothetical protein n=1 Tax=Bradyrhizobium sp. IC3195 TaxID=2793804 RepID=UPI001CD6FC32|nr:hypothetical protein [Bradyrhizobium sp. IC3195]MCA1471215.1 hypothetical protein [Bradyrhizobium sp. IC3195]